MDKQDAPSMPSLNLLAAMNILFIALPILALAYATWTVIEGKEQVSRHGAGRDSREKLAQFYGPFAALGGALAVSLGTAVLIRRRTARAYAAIRKFDVYARRPATLLLSLPGILAAGGLLLLVLVDFTVNQITGEPSWIQRGMEITLRLR